MGDLINCISDTYISIVDGYAPAPMGWGEISANNVDYYY